MWNKCPTHSCILPFNLKYNGNGQNNSMSLYNSYENIVKSHSISTCFSSFNPAIGIVIFGKNLFSSLKIAKSILFRDKGCCKVPGFYQNNFK